MSLYHEVCAALLYEIFMRDVRNFFHSHPTLCQKSDIFLFCQITSRFSLCSSPPVKSNASLDTCRSVSLVACSLLIRSSDRLCHCVFNHLSSKRYNTRNMKPFFSLAARKPRRQQEEGDDEWEVRACKMLSLHFPLNENFPSAINWAVNQNETMR